TGAEVGAQRRHPERLLDDLAAQCCAPGIDVARVALATVFSEKDLSAALADIAGAKREGAVLVGTTEALRIIDEGCLRSRLHSRPPLRQQPAAAAAARSRSPAGCRPSRARP